MDILYKEYELSIKSYDEHIKLFYAIPTLTVSITGIFINHYNVMVMAFGVFLIGVFIPKVIRRNTQTFKIS